MRRKSLSSAPPHVRFAVVEFIPLFSSSIHSTALLSCPETLIRGGISMLAPIYLAIESLLNVDGTLSPSDKSTILMVCQHPNRFISSAREPLPQLLNLREVVAMLKVSRATVWRMVKRGKLRQCMISSSPRFRLEDVMSVVEKGYQGTGGDDEQSTRTIP